MVSIIRGKPIIAGEAKGRTLVSHEPLSFWGGYDFRTGEIIDKRHPLSGALAANKILVIPSSRGSSTTTAVFLEAVREGTAPAAILTIGIDSFFALASIVADVMYGKPVPIVALSTEDFSTLKTGEELWVKPDGSVLRKRM